MYISVVDSLQVLTVSSSIKSCMKNVMGQMHQY